MYSADNSYPVPHFRDCRIQPPPLPLVTSFHPPKSNSMQKYLLTALLLATGMPLLSAQQIGFFMKIDGISGESMVAGQAHNFSVLTFRDSVDYQNHLVGPAGRTGERLQHHFTTRIPFDASTEQLQRLFESGKRMGKVELTYAGRGSNANNANAPKFAITVSDPVVSGLKLYTMDNNPTLYVELTFTGTSVQYSYPH